jgi:hypothetical protein
MIRSKARRLAKQAAVPFQRCTKASTPEEDSSCFLIAVAFVHSLKMFSPMVFIKNFRREADQGASFQTAQGDSDANEDAAGNFFCSQQNKRYI